VVVLVELLSNTRIASTCAPWISNTIDRDASPTKSFARRSHNPP